MYGNEVQEVQELQKSTTITGHIKTQDPLIEMPLKSV